MANDPGVTKWKMVADDAFWPMAYAAYHGFNNDDDCQDVAIAKQRFGEEKVAYQCRKMRSALQALPSEEEEIEALVWATLPMPPKGRNPSYAAGVKDATRAILTLLQRGR